MERCGTESRNDGKQNSKHNRHLSFRRLVLAEEELAHFGERRKKLKGGAVKCEGWVEFVRVRHAACEFSRVKNKPENLNHILCPGSIQL